MLLIEGNLPAEAECCHPVDEERGWINLKGRGENLNLRKDVRIKIKLDNGIYSSSALDGWTMVGDCFT